MNNEQELLAIGTHIVMSLSRQPLPSPLQWEYYHGFKKVPLANDRLPPGIAETQAEIVWVNGSLKDKVHKHDHADAAVWVLS